MKLLYKISTSYQVLNKVNTMRYELYVLVKDKWWLALKTPDEKYFDYKKKKFIKQGLKVKETVQRIGA